MSRLNERIVMRWRRAGAWLVVGIATAAVGVAVSAQAGGQVPSHPRELTYDPLVYEAPSPPDYRHVLANGVVAYIVEDHDLPLVSIRVNLRGGSYLDPAGLEGLASAVGSQLRSGGTARLSAEAFDEEVEFLAANLSSGIQGTTGSASANFLAKDTDAALSLFFEMLRTPRFQADRFDLYKTQQLQRMQRRNDATNRIESREWTRLMRGDAHFTSAFTTQASIEAISHDDLQAHHERFIHPGNFILAVSGDFDTPAMIRLLDQAMEGWAIPAETLPVVPEPTTTPTPGIYVVDKPDVNQGRVSIGHLGIRFGNADEIIVDLMNDILGGSGFTSRITNRVRSDEGLAYDAGSRFSAGVFYPGLFRATFQSKSESVAQAITIVLEEIERIRSEDVAAEELATVQSYATEIFPRFFSSAGAVAGTFANDELIGRDPQYWMTYRGRIRSATAGDLRRAAGAYIEPDNLVVLIVGNIEAIMKGDPNRPEYSIERLTDGRPIIRIPLPDPMTMVYPAVEP